MKSIIGFTLSFGLFICGATMAQAQGQEIEKWAGQHSGQWEEWAERFEKKMERWAQSQESAWEKWAEDYSGKWEELGRQLESGEFDSTEMSGLIERNLKMLGEMPLEQMMNGLMQEGLGELKDAPWESLNGLTDRIQESFDKSLGGLEKMSLEGTLDRIRMGSTSDDINSALEKLEQGLELKLNRLDSDGDATLRELKQLIQESGLDEAQIDQIREAAQAIKGETARRAAELKEQAKAAGQQALELKDAANTSDASADDDSAKAALLSRVIKAMTESTDTQKKGDIDAVVGTLVREAQRKRESIKSKDSDIEVLQKEIQELRKEVERLKKESGDGTPPV